MSKSRGKNLLKINFNSLINAVNEGKVPIDDAILGIDDIINGKFPPKKHFQDWYGYHKKGLSGSIKKSLQQQAARIERLDKLRNLGIGEFDIPFKEIDDFIPNSPTELLILVPYLSDTNTQSGLERTILELFLAIDAPEGYKKEYGQHLSKEALKNVISVTGSFNYAKPIVKVIAIDLYANINLRDAKFYDHKNSSPDWPGVEPLAAAIFLPDWLEGIESGKVNPQPKMPALQIKVGKGKNKQFEMLTLGLNISAKKSLLVLGTDIPKKEIECTFSIPTVRVIAECIMVR